MGNLEETKLRASDDASKSTRMNQSPSRAVFRLTVVTSSCVDLLQRLPYYDRLDHAFPPLCVPHYSFWG